MFRCLLCLSTWALNTGSTPSALPIPDNDHYIDPVVYFVFNETMSEIFIWLVVVFNSR